MKNLLFIEAKIFDTDPFVTDPVLVVSSIHNNGTWPPRVRITFQGESVDVASTDLIDAVRACANFVGDKK